jgi:hypothetical protein
MTTVQKSTAPALPFPQWVGEGGWGGRREVPN